MKLPGFYTDDLFKKANNASGLFDFAKPMYYNQDITLSKLEELTEMIENKNVLIVCGGGTSNRITTEILKKYDLVFSMNHFFLHSVLNNYPVDLCMMGTEVNIDNLNKKYLSKFKPMVGFEYQKRWVDDVDGMNRFYDNDKKFFMQTNVYTVLGSGVRIIIMSASLRAKSISFIGMDGAKSILKKNHAFQPGKSTMPDILKQDYDAVFKSQYDYYWKYSLRLEQSR